MNFSESPPKNIAIVGSGPAALMAADCLSAHSELVVTVFEKRPGIGRKLLIAGTSGLNITHDLPIEEFASVYTGPKEFWLRVVKAYSPEDWIQSIENLGIETFKGTSRRYFIKDKKASRFLKRWKERLVQQGVQFELGVECVDFESLGPAGVRLFFGPGSSRDFHAVCFALGGGSYEPDENPLRWPLMFKRKNIAFNEFVASNVGYQVDWTEKLLKEVEGNPLKGIVFQTAKGSRQGEMTITRYGLEGTPVYAVGVPGQASIDLKPEWSLEQIEEKLSAVRENYSPMRRIQKTLHLGATALSLIYHLGLSRLRSDDDLREIANLVKNFPIQLGNPQPITEAISSAGGIVLEELDEAMMLKKVPGVFAAGEMLDWDVSTGGFLIQGCVSQGFLASQGILNYLRIV